MTAKPIESKTAAVALPGTDGKQIAQGDLVDSWTETREGIATTFARVDIGSKTVKGELL